jgi:hypothetical protein
MRYPNFIDATNEQNSAAADCSRTINLMPEIVGRSGKNGVALIGTPGLTLLRAISGSSVRGMFEGDLQGSSYFYAVVDSTLYKVHKYGTSAQSIGSVGSDANAMPVSVAVGGVGKDAMIVSNGVAYSLINGVLSAISDLNGITCLDCCYLNGYWIVITNQGLFMRSNVGDVAGWDALNYDYPDTQVEDLVGCRANNGQVWFFGKTRTTIWVLNDTVDIGLAPLPGVVLQVGCWSKSTISIVDNAITWLARMSDGIAQVVTTRSYAPIRISGHSQELVLANNVAGLPTSYAVTTEEQGHIIYMLSVPGADTCPCYDASTGVWHERAYLYNNLFERHLAKCHMSKDGVHYVGSRNSGSIYSASRSVYTDAGNAIRRLRRAPHLSDEDNPLQICNFRLDIEKGVGGDGSNPQMNMRYSNNGGKTYSAAMSASIGETDDDPQAIAVEWNRLGVGKDYVFEVYSDAPVKHCWINAYLNTRR